LRCRFPVLKAGKDAPPELLEFTKVPPPNKQLAEHGRRYQARNTGRRFQAMEERAPCTLGAWCARVLAWARACDAKHRRTHAPTHPHAHAHTH